MTQDETQQVDYRIGAVCGARAQQPATAASLRAEIAALREEVDALRWEMVGGVSACVIAAATIAAAFAETGAAIPITVAAWVDQLELYGRLQGEGREAVETCLVRFTEILRALPAMLTGAWRPPREGASKERSHLRVVSATNAAPKASVLRNRPQGSAGALRRGGDQ